VDAQKSAAIACSLFSTLHLAGKEETKWLFYIVISKRLTDFGKHAKVKYDKLEEIRCILITGIMSSAALLEWEF